MLTVLGFALSVTSAMPRPVSEDGQADLAAMVVGVRAVVDHALGVVGVAGALQTERRVREAAGELRVLRLADVDHVERAAAGLAAHAVAPTA